MSWIDVTLPMAADTVHWPGHPRYTVTELMSIELGEGINVSAVAMCSHFGTHVETGRHYFADGMSVDEMPTDLLIGRCLVVAYEANNDIPPTFIDQLPLEGVKRLLVRTRNSGSLRHGAFSEDYVALTFAAAKSLAERGIEMLGVDGYSIGPFEPTIGKAVHRAFLGSGATQIAIEGLDLTGVDPGDYEIVTAPLRAVGLEAAPARVFIRRAEGGARGGNEAED